MYLLSHEMILGTILTLHLLATIMWIGSHFFEAFILHPSLRKVDDKTKIKIYYPLLFRFNKITGVSAAFTIYTGVLLAVLFAYHTLLPMITTSFGILSDLFFVALLFGLLYPLRPQLVSLLFNIAIASAVIAFAIVLVGSFLAYYHLSMVVYTKWGTIMIFGSISSLTLLIIGASQGLRRVKIAQLSSKILSNNIDQNDIVQLQLTEGKMLQTATYENVIAVIVIILMVAGVAYVPL